MKEIKSIIRDYVSDKSDIRATSVFDWFVSENAELWETFKEECAADGLLRIIKRIFNEHARPLTSNYSGVQQEFRLQEELKVLEKIPNLRTHVHLMDRDGVATYTTWQNATDAMLAADEAYSLKQSEDMGQRAKVMAKLRRLRDSLGIPPEATFSQHWDALRQ